MRSVHIEPEDISLCQLHLLQFSKIHKSSQFQIIESYFPETIFWRNGTSVIAEITEHIYTKFWEHKYHAMVFAEALVRAVKRLAVEGFDFANPSIENDDEPHIFIRWQMVFPSAISGTDIEKQIKDGFELAWERANQILENSDSVLLLGKDTGNSLRLLQRIKSVLEDRYGYHVYLIKEQADKLGESIIQKVLRYALISKFVIVENTTASGHLYEIPHVTKMAECITAILQQKGKGATWMFEDAYVKNLHWSKFMYNEPKRLKDAISKAVLWAEKTVASYSAHQAKTLPWQKQKPISASTHPPLRR
jgi:hypothetical protein